MEDTRLGAILLESGIIREEDLERCLEIQVLSGGHRPLGQILIEQGLIGPQTLDDLLAVQEARRARARGEIPVEGNDSNRYLMAAVRAGANELHLSEGRPPQARVGGELRSLSADDLAGPEVWQFVRDHMGADMLEVIADRRSVTMEFHQVGVGRGRITAFRHTDGIGVNVRLHPEAVRSLDDLGVGGVARSALASGKGLILLTGEQGNGITETFATFLVEAARHPSRYVIVLDDYLEYPFPQGGAKVCMRRVGMHTRGYESGLRAAMRENPDALFIGDASNPEAFNIALHAAESGKLVVAVVHGASTTEALERIIAFYPTYSQARIRSTLASVVNFVLAVRLLPDSERDGLLMATELLRFNDGVREVVRAGATQKLGLVLRLEHEECGHTMDSSLLALLRSGRVSFEDAFVFADDKKAVLQSMQSTGGRK
jgi:twitching motility protein PilT